MKTCSKCGSRKKNEKFYRDSRNKDGLKSSCKDCEIERTKLYQREHKEWYVAYQTTIRRENIDYIYTSRYDKMCRRANGYYGVYHSSEGKEVLTRKEFDLWCKNNELEFKILYEAWKDSGFSRKLTPTVDRKDNNIGYIASNMQWLSHYDNTMKEKLVGV